MGVEMNKDMENTFNRMAELGGSDQRLGNNTATVINAPLLPKDTRPAPAATDTGLVTVEADDIPGCPACGHAGRTGNVICDICTPVTDATGKCGKLETVGAVRQETIDGIALGQIGLIHPVGYDQQPIELVTRSQAAELLAAERAEKEELDAECRVLAKRCIEKDARIKELEETKAVIADDKKTLLDLAATNGDKVTALEAKLAAAEKSGVRHD